MFERRLKVLLWLLGLVTAVWVGRLAQLQALDGDKHRRRAERLLVRPPRYIPCARGAILDRAGRVLAADEPCWDICMDYGLLSGEPDYLRGLARRLGLDPDNPDEAKETSERIDQIWKRVAEQAALPVAELKRRGAAVCLRVEAVRDYVSARSGYRVKVREETLPHPIVAGLDDQQAVAAKIALARLPGVEVRTSTKRRVLDDPSLPHLVGRVGKVSAEDLQSDAFADDDLARLLPADVKGKSGAERLLDDRLRGRRGQVVEDRDGEVLGRTEPRRGQDVALSIDLAVQRRVYEVVGQAVAAYPQATGGSAVILQVATRQVLAMVSYPGYRASELNSRYSELLDDTKGTPLRFRAVANCYAPGSVCKPPALVAALSEGVCEATTTIACAGYLFPELRDRWRCWRPAGVGEPKHHGPMSPEEAIKNSCNIFFYTIGERLGAPRLCEWLGRFGIGRPPGTGLIEERPGVLPTPRWLARHRNRRVTAGDGRNFAIGQGEVSASPLQAANLAATLACGTYRAPTLLRDDAEPRAEQVLPVRPEHWEIVRRGMYRVVNEPGGTAARYISFESDEFDLYGKSGSAEAQRVALAFRVTYADQDELRTEIVRARYLGEARTRFRQHHPDVAREAITACEPIEWWPPPAGTSGRPPSHAWFVGFLKPKDGSGLKPQARVAMAAVIEYGGGGSQVAGPVVADLARVLTDEFPQYLSEDFAEQFTAEHLVASP